MTLDPNWSAWLSSVWPDLVQHGHAVAPPGLPPPSASGMSRPFLSERAGQARDWTLSLSDGSRVHVHEYANGTLVAHRDKFDPGAGVGSAFAHLVSETALGRFAFLAIVGLGFAMLASRLGLGFTRLSWGKMLVRNGL